MSHSDLAIEMDEAEARRIAEKDAYHYIPDDWAKGILAKWEKRLERAGFPGVDIQFSGFCSQGDGASFTCGWRPLPMSMEHVLAIDAAITHDQAVARLRNEYPRRGFMAVDEIRDGTTFRIIRDRGFRYVHECSTSVDVQEEFYGEIHGRTCEATTAWQLDAEDLIKEWMRRINRGIYRQLDRLHDLEYEAAIEYRTEQILNGEE
jgi:hypothetical protein